MGEEIGRSTPGGASRPRLQVVLDVCTSVAVIVAAGTLIWKSISARAVESPAAADITIPSQPILIDGAVIKGNSQTAKAALLEFADFQCPYCARFAERVLPDLLHYIDRGDLVVVFRNYPLGIHPLARKAAQVGECVGSQNAFWSLHDQFFTDPESLRDPIKTAELIGVGAAPLQRCLDTDADSRVKTDLSLGRALGVNSTPDFFIGQFQRPNMIKVTVRLKGTKPSSRFTQAIDKLLKE